MAVGRDFILRPGFQPALVIIVKLPTCFTSASRLLRRIRPAQPGHANVEQDHVGLVSGGELNRLMTVGRFRYHLEHACGAKCLSHNKQDI